MYGKVFVDTSELHVDTAFDVLDKVCQCLLAVHGWLEEGFRLSEHTVPPPSGWTSALTRRSPKTCPVEGFVVFVDTVEFHTDILYHVLDTACKCLPVLFCTGVGDVLAR